MSVYTDNGSGQRLDVGSALIGVGTLVTVVGAFLPWLTVGGLGDGASVSGIDMISDAVIPIFSPILTVGLALLAVALTIGVPDGDGARAGEIVAGAVIALVGVVVVVSPSTVVGGGLEGAMVETFAEPGIGTFATLAGGVLIAVGGGSNVFK